MPAMMTLEAGDARVSLRPDAGGRIGQIEVAGRRLLRGEDDADAMWYSWGSYPLVPWSNRIAGGEFVFRGTTYRMPVNFDDGTSLHGLAADVPWDVVAADRCSATLRVAVDTAPFRLTCEQTFVLGPGRLEQTLAVTNTAGHAVPVGLGIHPWFPDGPIALPATAAWPLENALPTGPPAPLPPSLDVSVLAEQPHLDHCLTALTERHAQVPGLRLEWSSEVTHLVAYTAVPGWQCVEPVTNANDAFNLMARGVDGHGVRVLEPAGTFAASFAFDWSGVW